MLARLGYESLCREAKGLMSNAISEEAAHRLLEINKKIARAIISDIDQKMYFLLLIKARNSATIDSLAWKACDILVDDFCARCVPLFDTEAAEKIIRPAQKPSG
jgi:hypothetical protein